jgi:hypothetical protein
MQIPPEVAMCLAANCENGTSCYELHSRVVWRKTLAAVITGLLLLVSSERILAVKRPLYPIKTEAPGSGHWVIISTNEETR